MNVIVYVEGRSDKRAMNELFRRLIESKKRQGVAISFFEAPDGDRKASILNRIPLLAANILLNNPDSYVVAVPDLYPYNKGFPHSNFQELKDGMLNIFLNALKKKQRAGDGETPDPRVVNRFRVFCFKHDLEALVLTAEKALCERLSATNINITWKIPVEDQDNNCPPKRIVEELFKSHNEKYKSSFDAPLILGAVDYRELCKKCPQCFKPFVEFLESVH